MHILATIEYFTPGFEGGGAIRSLEGLADALGDEIRFRIVTRDRDHGASAPYPGIAPGEWTRVGKAEVAYVPPGQAGRRAISSLLRRERYDALYLNSLFATDFTLLPLLLRRAGWIPRVPTILAPRGACTPGSMAIKRRRKASFLAAASALDLYDDLWWHAATADEARDVRAAFPKARRIVEAIDIPSVRSDLPRRPKEPGRLRLAFVGRIGRIKNLPFGISLLRDVPGEVSLDVYGPLEEPSSWDPCEAAIATLPPNVRVARRGPVPHAEVAEIFAGADLCFFPTLGESYGHVLAEALAAGCPLLVSDRTPWRGLEAHGVGWDLPLEAPERFVEVLRRVAAMGPDEHAAIAARARRMGEAAARSELVVAPSRALFAAALARGRSASAGL